MQNHKHGSHTIWDCKYHFVWVTKYRYSVLGGDVGLRCGELLREIARSKEMNTCRFSQSGSCAYADWNTAEFIGIERVTISERKGFS